MTTLLVSTNRINFDVQVGEVFNFCQLHTQVSVGKAWPVKGVTAGGGCSLNPHVVLTVQTVFWDQTSLWCLAEISAFVFISVSSNSSSESGKCYEIHGYFVPFHVYGFKSKCRCCLFSNLFSQEMSRTMMDNGSLDESREIKRNRLHYSDKTHHNHSFTW